MGRNHNPLVTGDKIVALVKGDIGSINKKVGLMAYNLVIFVHYQLFAEDIRLILYKDPFGVHKIIPFQSILKTGKKA